MDVLDVELDCFDGFRFRINPGSIPSSADMKPGAGRGASETTTGGRPGRGINYAEDEFDDGFDCGVSGLTGDQNGGTGQTAGHHENDDAYVVEVREPIPGKFEARVPVPSVLYGNVVGKHGATRNRIEKETSCNIRVPKPGMEGDVVLTATKKSSVLAAGRRLLMLVESQRHRLKFTHFVSLPVFKEPLISKIKEFRELVLEHCGGSSRLDERLFGKAEKMHITLLLFTLLDDRERATAVDMLKKCFEEKVRPKLAEIGRLEVRIRGLEIMNDDFASTQVLYGKVEPVYDKDGQRDLLQELADDVVYYFEKSGLTPEVRSENVKLHVTLMNAKNISSNDDSDDEGLASAWKPRPKSSFASFDSRPIFLNLKDFDFGTVEITEMHLSQLHTIGENGYYRSTIVFPLQ